MKLVLARITCSRCNNESKMVRRCGVLQVIMRASRHVAVDRIRAQVGYVEVLNLSGLFAV